MSIQTSTQLIKHPTVKPNSTTCDKPQLDPNETVFDFFDDFPSQIAIQPKLPIEQIPNEKLPVIDVTENANYLLKFNNEGFIWNEEVILSPPFSNSYSTSHSDDDCKIFPAALAEKLRKHRMNQGILKNVYSRNARG
jgi:hypothetical protein